MFGQNHDSHGDAHFFFRWLPAKADPTAVRFSCGFRVQPRVKPSHHTAHTTVWRALLGDAERGGSASQKQMKIAWKASVSSSVLNCIKYKYNGITGTTIGGRGAVGCRLVETPRDRMRKARPELNRLLPVYHCHLSLKNENHTQKNVVWLVFPSLAATKKFIFSLCNLPFRLKWRC